MIELNNKRIGYWKGKKLYQETKDKIRLCLINNKIGFQNGHIPWNKGKPAWNRGLKMNEEFRIKVSIAKKGKPSWNKGKKWSDEVRKNMSISKIGKHYSINTEFKKGMISWNKGTKGVMKAWNKGLHYKGKPCPEEIKKKISLAQKGKKISEEHKRKMIESLNRKRFFLGGWNTGINNAMYGKRPKKETLEKLSKTWFKKGQFSKENHWNWRGGISFEPYSYLFNQQLKDKIRVRDNFKCQLCSIPELECDRRLDVHHIDYDKKNLNENNLISLCKKCHMKTNHNRDYWKEYFLNKINMLKILIKENHI